MLGHGCPMLRVVPHVEDAEKKTKVTYAMFNNCHRNYAVANAMRLRELLKKEE